MKGKRGWSQTHAQQVWDGLVAKPGATYDFGGYLGAKRVEVPSNLAASDSQQNSKGKFEEKIYSRKSKDKKGMGEEEESNIKSELGIGFSFMAGAGLDAATFHAPLKQTAVTREVASDSGGLSTILL